MPTRAANARPLKLLLLVVLRLPVGVHLGGLVDVRHGRQLVRLHRRRVEDRLEGRPGLSVGAIGPVVAARVVVVTTIAACGPSSSTSGSGPPSGRGRSEARRTRTRSPGWKRSASGFAPLA